MLDPRKIALAAVAALAAPAALLATSAAPAQAEDAAAGEYVALGDSYSSGTGTRSYIDDGTSCQRSTAAYPSLIAAQQGYSLNFRACSGARIPDVTSGQLSALSSSTGYVTISVGGNDAGFADVLTECATPAWAGDCDGAIDGAQAYINGTLPGALGALYADIGSRAPAADVVVVGYPRVFMGEDCNALTWFSPEEQARLNETADLLNSKLSAAASSSGFSFANPTGAFTGHAVCDDPEWINGLSNPISESYHPNVAGHGSGYAPLVGPALTGLSAPVTAATYADARDAGAEQALLQRGYAGADRGIEPEVVRPFDVDSKAARQAARQAGIDLDRWAARHGVR